MRFIISIVNHTMQKKNMLNRKQETIFIDWYERRYVSHNDKYSNIPFGFVHKRRNSHHICKPRARWHWLCSMVVLLLLFMYACMLSLLHEIPIELNWVDVCRLNVASLVHVSVVLLLLVLLLVFHASMCWWRIASNCVCV